MDHECLYCGLVHPLIIQWEHQSKLEAEVEYTWKDGVKARLEKGMGEKRQYVDARDGDGLEQSTYELLARDSRIVRGPKRGAENRSSCLGSMTLVCHCIILYISGSLPLRHWVQDLRPLPVLPKATPWSEI